MHIRTLLCDDAALSSQLLDHCLTCIESIHAIEFGAGSSHHTMLIHDHDHLDVMALAHLEVIWIVGGSYLDCASSELGIDQFIFDDRDVAIDEWKEDLLADKVLITRISWMDGDCAIAEHRLGASGGDGDRDLVIAVTDLDELTFIITMFDFYIRKCSEAAWTPVDDPLCAIDQLLLIESLEYLQYRT